MLIQHLGSCLIVTLVCSYEFWADNSRFHSILKQTQLAKTQEEGVTIKEQREIYTKRDFPGGETSMKQ